MKKILILGGDGYLGWPTAMHLAELGYEVTVADNYSRRIIAEETDSCSLFRNPKLSDRCELFQEVSGCKIHSEICDLSEYELMFDLVKRCKPDTIIHYAEQPSAPYSMRGFKEADFTLKNNLGVTFNLIWAVKSLCPEAHIIKLGTMGEYGTPNIDIEEGWIEINHNGRSETFLYPRAASSLYHTTKVLDTDLLWFYVRTHGLCVTDLMQGPVYGILTKQTRLHPDLYPSFHYDDIFGTVVNRFVAQAVAGCPLTIYGKGGQTRGYLNLNDTLNCVTLSAQNPAKRGELKIYNQLTETFSVNQLALKVKEAGKLIDLKVEVQKIENPRKEKEEHYYNPKYSGLIELGLKPNYLTHDVLREMLISLTDVKQNINLSAFQPRVTWSG